MDARDALIELLLLRPGGDLLGVLGPDPFQLRAVALVRSDEIGVDRLVRSAQRQQDQHGRHASAVFAAGAMEEHRRLARFQRPEQLLVRLISEEHLLVHGVGHPAALIGLALQQLFPILRREVHLFAAVKAKPADADQPCTVRHIVRHLLGLLLAAQIEDEPQPKGIQQFPVCVAGQQTGGDAAIDLTPADMLALVRFVAAQLPEVAAARKGQLGARRGVGHRLFHRRAGKHGHIVKRLGRPTPPGRQRRRAPQHLHQVAAQQVEVGGIVIPPLHHGNAEGRHILNENVPHPVQLPPGPRLVAGQAGA